MSFSTVFHELAAILVIAGVLRVLALKLHPPLIIGYILTSIVVGFKLDAGLIRSVGPVALFTCLGQIVFAALFGFLLSLGLGFTPVKAIDIAVFITYFSPIIIFKPLMDKREIDSLHR